VSSRMICEVRAHFGTGFGGGVLLISYFTTVIAVNIVNRFFSEASVTPSEKSVKVP